MNSALAPNRLAVPPPLDLDLFVNDKRVGWTTRDVIGFCGFASEVEAAHAVWVAYRTLSRRLALRDGKRPVPIDTEPLSLTRDTDAVYAGDRTIGTLVRPGPNSRTGPDTFGFELRMPSSVDEVEVRASALVIYRTLRKSGIKWSLWQRDVPPSSRYAATPLDVSNAVDGRGERSRMARPNKSSALTAPVGALAVLAGVGLLLLLTALGAPEHLATVFAAMGLSALLAMRLFAMHTGWPRRVPRHHVTMEDAPC